MEFSRLASGKTNSGQDFAHKKPGHSPMHHVAMLQHDVPIRAFGHSDTFSDSEGRKWLVHEKLMAPAIAFYVLYRITILILILTLNFLIDSSHQSIDCLHCKVVELQPLNVDLKQQKSLFVFYISTVKRLTV